jgi:hypothetical protein
VDKLWITHPVRGARGEWRCGGVLGTKCGRQDRGEGSSGEREARPEGFEPPLSQIRSLRLYPLSYGRTLGTRSSASPYDQYTTSRVLAQYLRACSPHSPGAEASSCQLARGGNRTSEGTISLVPPGGIQYRSMCM